MVISSPENHDEYSASSTTVKFDRPIPLLRCPIPAGPLNDPGSGPYVLAFKTPESWAAAFRRCESQITEQCEGGARIGCATSASNKCKPPWWRALIGSNATDLKYRDRCEEGEMEGCLYAAKEKCVGLAKDKCSRPFMDVRIAMRDRGVGRKVVERFVYLVSMPERSMWRDLVGLGQLGSRVMEKCQIGVTNYRACELLGSDTNYESLFSSERI